MASDDSGPMVTDDRTRPSLQASWSADSALHWMTDEPGGQYPVVKNGSIVGFVSQSDIVRAIVAGYGSWPLERMLSVRFMPAPDRGS